MTEITNQNTTLEGGTYEIIRGRLQKQATDLRSRLDQLNSARKTVFGAIETQLIANDRIHTENYCTARDITAIGRYCIFGYNVHIGLRSGIRLEDVFSIYEFGENTFTERSLDLLQDDKFTTDFQNLYRYYKNASFSRFVVNGTYLYLVFNIGKQGSDFKAFKWLIKEDTLVYVDARSDHEVVFPDQHEFRWQRAQRDFHRQGAHPHVSIMDRVFVETVGGDLTIKVEDNTDDGLGIYREEVEYTEQTLDDAEYYYADLGNLIVLKIRPYQEDFRYFVYNEKMQEVQRIDSLEHSGVLLPDQHGLIFSSGYYLQTGEFKLFSADLNGLRFIKRITSSNGEDFLYIFYSLTDGLYVLMHYNLIEQVVNTPINCHGFTLFPQGELCYFRAEEEATKHHLVQIWQTPFLKGDLVPSEHTDSYLYKVGNKDIVKAMAESHEVLTLCQKEDRYVGLYDDLLRKCTDVLDTYYWIDKTPAFELHTPLLQIRETADLAIEEYEKKLRIERNTAAEIRRVQTKAEELFEKSKRQSFDAVDLFVQMLAELRILRGEVISLKELRYTDLELVDHLETQATEITELLSQDCVAFLLRDDALEPYIEKIAEQEGELEKVTTAKEGKELDAAIDAIGKELELLIEIVSNLKIEDATQTTRIVDNISGMYAKLNQLKAAVKKKQKSLMGTEAIAEFNAQLKLLDQGMINYLDLADSPDKCDEYLTKLMVQLEELEGKFAEFEEFIGTITEKREEIFAAFDSKKTSLLEARNNRTAALQKAAERILKGIQNRVKSISDSSEINGFFAADLMVDKVRDLIQQLIDLEDDNKASAIQTQLKTIQEQALRQLRDRQDLFVDGANIIQLGRHRFPVNVQPLDLTIVRNGNEMAFHLTGTDFFQTIQNEDFQQTQDLWSQSLISENDKVYRSEYLAYQLLEQEDWQNWNGDREGLVEMVREAATSRYQEGYVKGIHDEDALSILQALLEVSAGIDLLYFDPEVRACGRVFWKRFMVEAQQQALHQQLQSAGVLLQVFPDNHEYDFLMEELKVALDDFISSTQLFPNIDTRAVARYLFLELTRSDVFIASRSAVECYQAFLQFLEDKKAGKNYRTSVAQLETQPVGQYQLMRKWVQAFMEQEQPTAHNWQDEVVSFLFLDDFPQAEVIKANTDLKIEELRGNHPQIEASPYQVSYNDFVQRLRSFTLQTVPRYLAYSELKKGLLMDYRKQLRLEEFKPRVLSSFVRNQLIDQVYLPIFGDNLAKQIGTAGENTRTDRMGLLLLLSPPGYGKTTLMEYIADRLGLVFVKVNGPALGHRVTALDPTEAPNAAARQELLKLNLALEMGNNVMLYVDDIQHCNPEFLQKFISLCDAQRKIEGVYNGQSKTYDLRGKRICVVMAGNPYTESGERFQIPDMLANRADIYNLGDIIGDTEEAFKLSYIENSLTSNSILRKLATKSPQDLPVLLRMLSSGSREGLELEGNHSPEELREYQKVLEMLLQVRDVVLRVNQEYIRSAAIAEEYRTEPMFKLQGSYRDMNKLAEKILPIMNQKELDTLLLSHYEGEAQTLTSGAEANFLKLKELLGILNEEETERWNDILNTFRKNQRFQGINQGEPMAQVLVQMTALTEGLSGIKDVLRNATGYFDGGGD